MPENSSIEQLIPAKVKSIGAADVLRVLPTVKRRTVGPFVFIDHMGPPAEGEAPVPIGDVPPHPHIGIATVTYLFEGAGFHRDSIGSEQLIEPGGVNWMSSGRGIVHSERTPEHLRDDPPPTFGVQSWVALPKGGEDVEPSFQHFSASELPVIEGEGKLVRLVAGTGFELESPVRVASPLICAALELQDAARVVIPSDHEERALIVLDGEVELDGEPVAHSHMAVLRGGTEPLLFARGAVRAFLVGGPPLPERRYLDWNFCHTRRERIEEAKELYRKGLLGTIPGEVENLPLPEDSK